MRFVSLMRSLMGDLSQQTKCNNSKILWMSVVLLTWVMKEISLPGTKNVGVEVLCGKD